MSGTTEKLSAMARRASTTSTDCTTEDTCAVARQTATLARIANNGTVVAMTTMNVSLPDSLREFVESQVAERHYGTTSEYVRDLIRRDQDRVALRRMLLDGAQSEPAAAADTTWFDELRATAGRPSDG